MSPVKNRVFVAFIVCQSVIIVALLFKAIALRNDLLFAEGEADYYKKALTEMSEKDPLIEQMLQERADLLEEYSTTEKMAEEYRGGKSL